MAKVDRAFRVIVLGGIALAAAPAAACGGTTASPGDAGIGADAADSGFPQEGAADSGFPQEGAVDSSFPMETGMQLDTGITTMDAFPQEGPAMILDSGAGDTGTVDSGFPQETAQAADP
jgi:hypothetical protein